MVRVLDEKRSVDFYKKAFNLTVADRLDFSGFTLVYLSNEESDFELELTINKDQNDAYELGSGYGHFAVSVDNLDSEHSRLEAEGLAPRKLHASFLSVTPMVMRLKCLNAVGGSNDTRGNQHDTNRIA